MKNCYLVKFVSVFCMFLCLQAQGQTYFNFAMSNNIGPSHSIIRPVNTYQAVAYYDGTGGVAPSMVLLDLNSIISANGLTLTPEYVVKDIRILDGVAYFCGRNTIN